ncbi:hypothetical protein KC19_8G114300 [Ceratodon purpureus]|uniref:COR domain-containing protein n=1 Tax=Ceratodon purpureus TaxID=3225 RepID=A0A8T0GXS4_CERPU|nr:hypothetical protein KC19_8G114300 [Ceratodon purpureus]
MQTWLKFILWIVKLATWKELVFWVLRRAPPQETNELNQLAGSQPVRERELEVKAAAMDDLCSTSKSPNAHEIELEAVLSAISTEKRLRFNISASSFKLSTMNSNDEYTQIFEKNASFNQDEYMQIIRAIASSTTMMDIRLHFNLGKESCIEMLEQFHEAIRSNQRIESVQVVEHDVSIDWLVATFCDLLESDKLHQLLCGGCGPRLSLSTVEKLATGIRRTQTLTNLVFYTTDPLGWIDTSGLKLFLDPFMDGEGSNRSVIGFGINKAGIDNDGAKIVASMLCHNTTLLHLSVLGSKIGPEGAIYIAEALRTNTKLYQFFIHDNPIGAEGLRALVGSLTQSSSDGNLKPNTTLRVLHVGDNIGNFKEGIELLETLVQENDSLSALHLQNSSLLEDADSVIRLLEALKKNQCLKLVDLEGCSGVMGRKVLGTILDLLQVNHHLKEIRLSDTPLEADGGAELVLAQLEKKEKDRIWEVLQGMATVRPNYAKVFLCGYPFAGKTTLRQSIMKTLKCESKPQSWKNSLKYRSVLSRLRTNKANEVSNESTKRTRGIEVHTMSFDNVLVTMWDMAGHDDYHSFHDLVIPNLTGDGGSACTFLLVCNLFQTGNIYQDKLKTLQDITDEFIYWLQFIASNSRISMSYKPQVTIVLTNVDRLSTSSTILPRVLDKVDSLRIQFEDILEIHKDVFALNALSLESIRPLYLSMKCHLKKLLDKLPPVFEACSKMQVILAKWNQEHSTQPLLRWDAFASLCDEVEELKTQPGTQSEIVKRKKEVLAMSLHDGGQVMYNEDFNFVVVNPHWFCHDIIGHVLKSKELDAFDGITNGSITKVDFKHVVLASFQGNLQGFNFDDLLQMMIKLELCYEQDNDEILIPSLLQDDDDQSIFGKRCLRWPSQEKRSTWQYIGCRMVCNDDSRTVLTLGFFPRLQVAFQKLFGKHKGENSYKLAKNLLSFNSNGMEVIVEYSGQIGFDIDIMMRSASASKDFMLEFLHEDIMKPIYSLCAHPVLGCQGVKLEEGILRPACVEGLVPRRFRKEQVVLVEKLKRIILASNNYSYVHNWEEEGSLERGYDDAQTLLGKKAWEDILNRHIKDLRKLQESVHCESKFQECIIDEPLWLHMGDDEFNDDVRLADVYKLVHKIGKDLHKRTKESEASIMKKLDDMEGRITRKLEKIQSLQEHLLPNICGKIDELMTFSVDLQQAQVPKLVYFTASHKNSLRSIVTRMVPGLTNLHLHLMCEHHGGFHIVTNQKGCDVSFGTDSTKVFQTILIWGLKIFTILVKIGAHVGAGMGSMVPNLAKDFMLVLDSPSLLDAWELPISDQQYWRKQPITETDRRVAEQWLIEFLKGKNLRELFSLQKVKYSGSGGGQGSIAWLCNDHLKEGLANSTLILLPY